MSVVVIFYVLNVPIVTQISTCLSLSQNITIDIFTKINQILRTAIISEFKNKEYHEANPSLW